MALRLKELKKLFDHHTVKGYFKFESSALKLFEMGHMNITSATDESHFWYPLNPKDLWIPFVHCMMTVLDEFTQQSKYYHILLVEFYEWIARIAIIYFHLQRTLKPDYDGSES